ncbi:unnamed protein product [Allacma fusca]|uniref:Uncharacterized protein n=2 Tax=Allacma fusca TaxID=39272 RepID=A0A8J2LS33_9HEXA|nr:unnamed protein product [Allacma fusca]
MRLLDYSVLLLGSTAAFACADNTSPNTRNLQKVGIIQEGQGVNPLLPRMVRARTKQTARKGSGLSKLHKQLATKSARARSAPDAGEVKVPYRTRSHGSPNPSA